MLFLRFAGVTSPPRSPSPTRRGGRCWLMGGRMFLGLIVVCIGLVVVIRKDFIVIEGSPFDLGSQISDIGLLHSLGLKIPQSAIQYPKLSVPGRKNSVGLSVLSVVINGTSSRFGRSIVSVSLYSGKLFGPEVGSSVAPPWKRKSTCEDTPPAEAGHEGVPTYHKPPNRHSRFAASANEESTKRIVLRFSARRAKPNQTQNLSVASALSVVPIPQALPQRTLQVLLTFELFPPTVARFNLITNTGKSRRDKPANNPKILCVLRAL